MMLNAHKVAEAANRCAMAIEKERLQRQKRAVGRYLNKPVYSGLWSWLIRRPLYTPKTGEDALKAAIDHNDNDATTCHLYANRQYQAAVAIIKACDLCESEFIEMTLDEFQPISTWVVAGDGVKWEPCRSCAHHSIVQGVHTCAGTGVTAPCRDVPVCQWKSKKEV